MNIQSKFEGAPRLHVPKRHVWAALSGAKTQVIVAGRRTPVPSHYDDKRFALVTGGTVFAYGYASETTDFHFDFDNDVCEIDYQYWDGESEGLQLRDPAAIRAHIDSCDSPSFREFAESLWWRGDREAFAKREGFADWAALARFHSRDRQRVRGTVVRWTSPLEVVGDPCEDIPEVAPRARAALRPAAA